MLMLLQDAAERSLPLLDGRPAVVRVLGILALALAAHFVVRMLRRAGEWVVTPASSPEVARELFERRQPKVASLTTLMVSAATFFIYFAALGLILDVFAISLTAYFASASVIALAVGFGSQGLVQDVVIGITLIFSDAFNIGDVVEISGQVGRVDKIGLRFTTLSNFLGQTVYIPNRNIGLIGRYRRGVVRIYVDVQLPDAADEAAIDAVRRVAGGMRAQQPAIVLSEPELLGPFSAGAGGWHYVRVKFRVWPGQGAFIETAFRQRVLGALRQLDPAYADWMIVVSYRVGS
jgi:moderate conductance mechanosensitive channel